MAWVKAGVAQDRLKAKGRVSQLALSFLTFRELSWLAFQLGLTKRGCPVLILIVLVSSYKKGKKGNRGLLNYFERRTAIPQRETSWRRFTHHRFEHPFCSAYSRSFTRYWKGGITTSKLLSLNSLLTLSLVPSLSILLFVAPPGFSRPGLARGRKLRCRVTIWCDDSRECIRTIVTDLIGLRI